MTRLHINRGGDLRIVWHPSPKAETIQTEQGNLLVREGPPKAQLSSGEFVDL